MKEEITQKSKPQINDHPLESTKEGSREPKYVEVYNSLRIEIRPVLREIEVNN